MSSLFAINFGNRKIIVAGDFRFNTKYEKRINFKQYNCLKCLLLYRVPNSNQERNAPICEKLLAQAISVDVIYCA